MERKVELVSFPTPMPKLLRVAAYARVSTGQDAMLHSLAAQVSYYSNLIQSNPGWIYCGVYNDEAKTGTKENSQGFQDMLAACRAGKIDRIITKSVSRFARNTVDTLTAVRELKALGIDIYFEEQNIHTCGPDGELILTIIAAYAQAESLSASNNQKWRVKEAFEDGKLFNLRFLFGYRITKDGITIDPDEAAIVREIFTRFIAGESMTSIGRDLEHCKIPRYFEGPWDTRRVRDVITNEKYCGNALLWKTYRENHLTKQKRKNTGQQNMYYVEDSHPAIIDEDTFKAAAERLRIISHSQKHHPSLFQGKIHCCSCGKNFRFKERRGRPGYQCSTYLSHGKVACPAKFIPEQTLIETTASVPEGFIRIDVPKANHLLYVYVDHTIERTWLDHSRSESWTNEMKADARRKQNAKKC